MLNYCAVQIYTFTDMALLLEALPLIWDPDPKTKENARSMVALIKEDNELTEEEISVLSEDSESVERLKAILVSEHNSVATRAKKNSLYQELMHIRSSLQKDAQETGLPFPAKIHDIPMKKRKEFMTWMNSKRTVVDERIKLAILSEANFTLLLSIMKAYKENRLKGQGRAKKKDEEEKDMPTKGVDDIVQHVDDAGITLVLTEVQAGKMDLNSLKDWVGLWKGTRSKLFSILHFLFPLCYCGFHIMLHVL